MVELRELDYEDSQGRRWRVRLPVNLGDEHAAQGLLIGPMPIVDSLNLCEPFATRLHNELHRRNLWRLRDIQQRRGDLQAAILAAHRLDAQTIEGEYSRLERSEETKA